MNSNNPEQDSPQPSSSGIQRLNVNTSQPGADEASSGSTGSPAPPPPPRNSGSSKMLVRLLMLVILALGGWYYFGQSGRASLTEQESPMYQKQKLGASTTPVGLSAADLDRASGDAAMRGDPIPFLANPTPEFTQAVKDGKVKFYFVRLYDTCVEDGDVVTLRLSSGVEIGPVPLKNAGTTVSFPVVAGEAPQVTVIGIKDGTGGITVGVQSSGGMWYSGVMAPGDTETMPLMVR
jgi:hypothetical protein